MITTPRASVRPEQELARLTLISSTNEAEIRRRSTVSGLRPSLLGEINGMPVAGPLGPPQPAEANSSDNIPTENIISAEDTQVKDPVASDIDSEVTLVSEPTHVKEDQAGSVQQTIEGSDNQNPPNDVSQPAENVEPPNRPPPVPPRPAEAQRSKQLIEEVELGAQQDVTEVINNVLFQSECAIKPRALESDGEQVDIVKEYETHFSSF
jgi:ubiquitin carboxyl-terminal hydrolase 25/28